MRLQSMTWENGKCLQNAIPTVWLKVKTGEKKPEWVQKERDLDLYKEEGQHWLLCECLNKINDLLIGFFIPDDKR